MNKKIKTPPKWTQVYPQGTKEGDEEYEVFIVLCRHPRWTFRSLASLAKEANLSLKRTEEILYKYLKKNIVFQNPKNEDQWAYWEREPGLLEEKESSLADQDHADRLEKHKQSYEN